jgi:hypothetical protein
MTNQGCGVITLEQHIFYGQVKHVEIDYHFV